MEHRQFPTDACVLACSGPSLNTVDPFSLGLPVVAVSTVIRKLTKPDFWIIADYLNEMHGEEGTNAYKDSQIIKVIPEGKLSQGLNAQNVVLADYQTNAGYPNLDEVLFTGNTPFIRGPHKSVTFAIQWLHHVGVKTVIWVGNDLKANSMQEKYCYKVEEYDMKKAYNYDKTLDQTRDALMHWHPIALKRGFQWFSWNCGEVFESIVPKFDIDWWNTTGKASMKQYEPIVFPKAETPVPPPIEVQQKKTKQEVITVERIPRHKIVQEPNPKVQRGFILQDYANIPVISETQNIRESKDSERRIARNRMMEVKRNLKK